MESNNVQGHESGCQKYDKGFEDGYSAAIKYDKGIAALQAKCEQQAQDIEQYKEIAKDYGHASDKIFKRDKEIEELQARCDSYEKALKVVQKWQLPTTGQFWDKEQKEPMSYEACYGSNGARDFMRNVANEALKGEGEKEVDNEP